MTSYFLDTSALVKHYRMEAGSERIDALFADAESDLLISELGIVEFASTFQRLKNRREIEADAFSRALDRFTFDTTHRLTVLEFRSDSIKLARELVLKRSLRTLDALQVACALSAKSDDLVFASADTHLLTAARTNDLQILNPLE